MRAPSARSPRGTGHLRRAGNVSPSLRKSLLPCTPRRTNPVGALVPAIERRRFSARKFGNRFLEEGEVYRLGKVCGEASVPTLNDILFHPKSAYGNRAERG